MKTLKRGLGHLEVICGKGSVECIEGCGIDPVHHQARPRGDGLDLHGNGRHTAGTATGGKEGEKGEADDRDDTARGMDHGAGA